MRAHIKVRVECNYFNIGVYTVKVRARGCARAIWVGILVSNC